MNAVAPGSNEISSTLISWLRSKIRSPKGDMSVTDAQRILVEEFSQNPEVLESKALELTWQGMRTVLQNAAGSLKLEEQQEGEESVRAFYELLAQVEQSLPYELQQLGAQDFLEQDDYENKRGIEERKEQTEQALLAAKERKNQLTNDNRMYTHEVARRKGLQKWQIAAEVIDALIASVEDSIVTFPERLKTFHFPGTLSEEDQELIRAYRGANEKIIALGDLKSNMRELPNDQVEKRIGESVYKVELQQGIEAYGKDASAMNSTVAANSEEIGRLSSTISREENKLTGQNDQLEVFVSLIEANQEKYYAALLQAFAEVLKNNPDAMEVIEAYMSAQNELYTEAQNTAATTGGLKGLIRKLDSTIHQGSDNIRAKFLSGLFSLGVAGWGGFQTFRGLMNLLPRHADSLPDSFKEALMNLDGSPNQDAIKLRSALIGISFFFVSKKWMSNVNNNMKDIENTTIQDHTGMKEVFWNRLSWPKRSAMMVVVLMIIMDITGHMATFMGTDKKKLEGKKIEAAKSDLEKEIVYMSTYMTGVPVESKEKTETLLETEKAQGGAGKLRAAKHRVTVGGTDGVDSEQFPEAVEQSGAIVENAGGHDGMLLEAQQALEADMKHLKGMQNISYKGETLLWAQVPGKVLSLGSGVFDLEVNMEMQEIVNKFNISVAAYVEEAKRIAEKYNASVDKLEQILKKMEQGTYADRQPLTFDAIDADKLQGQITKMQAAAQRFAAELKKVDPNFDMFDVSATLKFFGDADFGMLGLAERLLVILGLSFLPIWYMLMKYRGFKKRMRGRGVRLDGIAKELLEVREQFDAMIATIAPYLTHVDMQGHLREMFEQMGATFDETTPLQDQLLTYIDNETDEATELIVSDMCGITAVRDPRFSELPKNDQDAMPRRKKKAMKKQEQLERAYQDGRMRRVTQEIKQLIVDNKDVIDGELKSFYNTLSVKGKPHKKRFLRQLGVSDNQMNAESYTDRFLRHEGYTEETLVAVLAEFIKRSDVFKKLFFAWYNTKDHEPIQTEDPSALAVVSNTPTAPTPSKNRRNGWGLLNRSGGSSGNV